MASPTLFDHDEQQSAMTPQHPTTPAPGDAHAHTVGNDYGTPQPGKPAPRRDRSMNSIERFIDAAHSHGLRTENRRDDECMVQCPAHEDNSPSLHVTYDHEHRCVLLKCFAGCTSRDVLKALKLDWGDLFDTPRSTPNASRMAYRRIAKAPKALADGTRQRNTDKTAWEPFDIPAPYVPEQERGELSTQFKDICDHLGVTPAYGPMDAVCPVCGEVDALRVLYAPFTTATLLRCKSCTNDRTHAERLANALQVEPARVGTNGHVVMAYDQPHGTTYEYPDGLRVSRSPAKDIRQHGHKGGRHPLWRAEEVAGYAKQGHPVFLVEGEKDAAVLWACGYAATTAPGGGGNLHSTLDADAAEATLSGANVIAVTDRDNVGDKWRSQVAELLSAAAGSLTVARAAGEAHDAGDAVMFAERLERQPVPNPTPEPSASAAPRLVEDVSGVESDGSDPDVDESEMERFERFWLEAPYLTRIRDVARQRLVSPWGSFMALLARVATVLPPHVVGPAFVGAHDVSLNMFVALVGPSGMGKGAAEGVAEALLPDLRGAVTLQPGSGEGLVTMFCERVADESGTEDGSVRSVLRCSNPRALLSVPEVSTLGAVMGRQGSTLAGELTKAWSGEPLGSRTKYAAGTFQAPRYGYRLGLVVGVQPGNAGVLFSEADTGLPQRFLWADMRDDKSHIIDYEQWRPLSRPIEPLVDVTRFPEDCPGIQSLYCQGDRWNMIDHGSGYPLTCIRYPEAACRATFEQRRANVAGELPDGLDAHGNLVRLKVAALLPWLDPDREDPLVVSDADWRLSGEVLAYSRMVRRRCMEDEQDGRRRRAADTAKLKLDAARDARDNAEDLREKTPEQIEKFLTKGERIGGTFTGKQIRNGLRPQYRHYVYDALVGMAEEDGPKVLCVSQGATVSGSRWRWNIGLGQVDARP